MKGIHTIFRLFLPLAPLAIIVPVALKEVTQEQDTARPRSSPLPQALFSEEERWTDYLHSRPRLSEHREILHKLSSRLPLETFTALSPALQDRLARFAANQLNPNIPAMTHCWAPGVSMEVMEAFHAAEELAGDEPGPISEATQFSDGDRWGRNATFNSIFEPIEQGRPTTLRWSFMPDGTSIFGFNGEPTADSDLISFLDTRYGVTNGGSDLTTRPWFLVFQAAFDNIASLTGVSYVYEPNDDGARLTQSSSPSGRIGVRGDIRIGGHFIDGESGSNTLAYNFSPSSGDMVIDTGNPQFYGNTSSNSLNLRNVVEHEHGHGLGLSHVCPITQTKLMEPFISRLFRGLQLDDIFSLNRLYGDFFEKQNSARNNDSSANASVLPLTIGTPYQREYLSIDDNSDLDFYRLNNIPANTLITCRITPVATPNGFREGPQNQDGSCSAGSLFGFTNIHDLRLDLIAANGTTILASANSQPMGQPEEIIAFQAPTTGTYFLRVTGGSANSTQLYDLEIISGTAPAPPTNLLTDTSSPGTVTLTWIDESTNESAFQIERKTERDGPWSIYDLAPENAELYQDTSPIPGANHFYRITALSDLADSPPSTEATAMVVDLTSQSYFYDLGTTTSPLSPDAFRISRLTSGDISWDGPVTSRDRGGPNLSDRDYLFASDPRTLSHRLANGLWQVTIRQGDETDPREALTISAEGVLQAENIATAANEFIESTFIVEISDGVLDLTFDDLGGASDRWVVNRLELRFISPYQAWALRESLPESLTDPTQDPDNDGIPNVQEYYFGLPPLSAGPPIAISSAISSDGTNYLFTFSRDPGAIVDSVVFEASTDLITWLPFTPPPQNISTTPNGQLEEVILTLPTSTNQRFIRLGLTLAE